MSKLIQFSDNGYDSLAQYAYIPEHMRDTVENYLIHGYHPGGFMMAMFAGDMFRACQCADQVNGPSMLHIAQWIVFEAPLGSWGSYDAVENWCHDIEKRRSIFRDKKEKEYIIKALKE